MPIPIAEKIVEFAFRTNPPSEKMYMGFFGGEPFLAFDQIAAITQMVQRHPLYPKREVELSVVSNGTIFTDTIADFLSANNIYLCVSCDGPPFIQNRSRSFPNGRGSSDIVERTIRHAVRELPCVLVNAVYHPGNFRHLPGVVDYFSSLGVRQIYLNPDFSAPWSQTDADALPEVYGEIANRYIAYYLKDDPHFISLIDSKITVILRDGYTAPERCRMGRGEFAFTPSGNIYPCERLIGDDTGEHSIGDIFNGLDLARMVCNTTVPARDANKACASCGLKSYCMNWCGCSNYFSTGYYNKVGPFLCASERASIEASFHVFQTLEQTLGPTFADHLAGMPARTAMKTMV